MKTVTHAMSRLNVIPLSMLCMTAGLMLAARFIGA